MLVLLSFLYLQSRSHYHQNETLSKTNLYIRGLTPNTNDQDLINLCQHYGKIVSTKAIVDQATNKCKGEHVDSNSSSICNNKQAYFLVLMRVQFYCCYAACFL